MSVKTVVYAMLFVAGVLMALYYGNDYMNYRHPMDMSLASSTTLKKNGYVACVVTEYLGKGKGEAFIPVIRTHLGLNDYDFYYVPLYDGTYVEIGVYDLGLRDDLAGYKEGVGSGVNFVGRVQVKGGKPNINADDFPDFDINRLNTQYSIVQVGSAIGWNKLLIGVFLAIASLIGFFTSFTVRYVSEERLDEYGEALQDENGVRKRSYGSSNRKKKKKRRDNVNYEYELELANRRIENIKRDAEKLKVWIAGGITCVICGVAIIVLVKSSIALIGVILCVFGVERLWKVFFNSSNKLAVTLAEVFNIKTLYVRLKHAEAQRAEIEAEIDKDKAGKTENDVVHINKDSIIIDCAKNFEDFMMKIENNTYYCFINGDEQTQLLVNADAENKKDRYLQWGAKTRDISGVVEYAAREAYFIHLGDVNGLWLVANDPDRDVLKITTYRLHDNGNIDSDNINYGMKYAEGELIDPSKLKLIREIKCIDTVTATAEYHLTNAVKPELNDDGGLYYYVDKEYCEEEFVLQAGADIKAWIVPEKEGAIDKCMGEYPIETIPACTKFRRYRIPRKASRSYVDLRLEDGRIMRVVEEYRFIDSDSYQEMLDAEGQPFEYYTGAKWEVLSKHIDVPAAAGTNADKYAGEGMSSDKSAESDVSAEYSDAGEDIPGVYE